MYVLGRLRWRLRRLWHRVCNRPPMPAAERERLIREYRERAAQAQGESDAGVAEQDAVRAIGGALEASYYGTLASGLVMARPGVAFTPEQQARIRAAQDAGDTAEAQRAILDQLAKGADEGEGRGDNRDE